MKWFKHKSNSSENKFIENLEELFGLEGYARWFKILEKIALEMDESNKCYAEHSWIKWQSFLKGKRNKLETFLEHCQNENRIKLEQTGNILRISCPNILELRDNYTKDLQATSKNTCKPLGSKNQIQESRKKEDLFNGIEKIEENVDNFSKKPIEAPVASGLFDVDNFLSPLDRQRARAAAPLWDMEFLIKKFNHFVSDKEIPKYPGNAFVAWCKSFVKGKEP